MEPRLIKTDEEAKFIAYQWAAREGADPVQMAAYSVNCFKRDGPLPEVFLLDSLRHFHAVTSDARRQWKDGAQEMWRLHTEWSIETVKHLAILNTGGVAGCAALLATQRVLNDVALRIGIVVFSIGLICTVLTFWLGSVAYSKRTKLMNDRVNELAKAADWKQYVEASRKYEDPGERWTNAALCTGWSAASTALVGAAALVIALWSTSASPAPINQLPASAQAIR